MRVIYTKFLKNPMTYVKITPTGCWEWQGSKNPDGYGRVFGGNEKMPAHWWFYEQKYGKLPRNKRIVLDHVVCNNPPCCNPDHVQRSTRWRNATRENKPWSHIRR